MAHVSGVPFAESRTEPNRWSEYAVVVFSIGKALQPYGVQTALAPPQKGTSWVLLNKPKASGDNSWPPEASKGLDAGRLEGVFDEGAVMETLRKIPGGAYMQAIVAAQFSPQRALKSVLLSVRPSGETTLPLGLGKPLIDVALYRYADNKLLWQCRMTGKPFVVRTPGKMFEASRELGSAFTVMPELVLLLQEAGYIAPESRGNYPKAFAYPNE